jgi:uncharacterized membrane protein YdjX (TVP38/TMEM64 family)
MKQDSDRDRTPWAQIIALVLFLAVAVAVSVLLRRGLGIDVFSKQAVEEAIASTGPWAQLAYVGLLAVTVVVSWLPGVPLAMAAGMMWGTAAATALSVLGGLTGALIAYCIGRCIGASIVESLTRTRITPRPGHGTISLAAFLFVTRLIPVFPFDVLSYAAGIARLPVVLYAVVTAAGMTPPVLLLARTGEMIPHAPLIGIGVSVVAAIGVLVLARPRGSGLLNRYFELERISRGSGEDER